MSQSFWQRKFNLWLERRLPRVPAVTLSHRSIFTFPSRVGMAFFALLILLWLLATNYENNVVFMFAALLGAMVVISIFHGFTNLAGLQLRVLAVEDGFPGDQVRVDVEVSQQGKRPRDDLWLHFADTTPQRVSLVTGERAAIASLYVPARRRGHLHLGRLTVESVYPLGLIRVWTHVLLAGAGVVYPQPVSGAPQATASGDSTDKPVGEIVGSEDFSALNPYRAGESFSRIAWKQVARGQGLYSKHFVDPIADPQWLDWDHYPGLDREARLSRLCADVLHAAASDQPFGVRLPGQVSNLGQGEGHREALLRMLGLFEAEALR